MKNENKKDETFKEKVNKFIDDYGPIIPIAIGLTLMNTISIAVLKKNIKHNNEILTVYVNALADSVEEMDDDISIIKKAISSTIKE